MQTFTKISILILSLALPFSVHADDSSSGDGSSSSSNSGGGIGSFFNRIANQAQSAATVAAKAVVHTASNVNQKIQQLNQSYDQPSSNCNPMWPDTSSLADPPIDARAPVVATTRPLNPPKPDAIYVTPQPPALTNILSKGCSDPTLVNGDWENRMNQGFGAPGNNLVMARTTDKSFLDLQIKLPPSQKHIWIVVRNTDTDTEVAQSEVRQPISDCYVHLPVILPYGNGTHYDVQIYANDSNNPDAGYLPVQTIGVVNYDRRPTARYLLPTQYVQSNDPEIQSTALAIVANAGAKTDLEKVRAIHDWVAKNVAYDADGFSSGKLPNYTAKMVLDENPRVAVCQGYSELFAGLARAAGIPTKIVDGQGVVGGKYEPGQTDHAWNQVYLNGQWRNIDTTWDSGQLGSKNGKYVFMPNYSTQYFLTDDATFFKDHTPVDPAAEAAYMKKSYLEAAAASGQKNIEMPSLFVTSEDY